MKKFPFRMALPGGFTATLGLFLLLLSTLAFTACSPDKEKRQALEKETEEIHNTAMKEVADMNRVARELKQLMIVSTMTAEQSAVFTDVLTAIGKAENDMNEWMVNLKNTDELSDAEAIKELEAQKIFLEKNLQDIRAAMEAGKKLQGNPGG